MCRIKLFIYFSLFLFVVMLKLFLMPFPSFEYSITRLLYITAWPLPASHNSVWCYILIRCSKPARGSETGVTHFRNSYGSLHKSVFKTRPKEYANFTFRYCHYVITAKEVSLSHTLYRYSGCETFVLVLEGSRETFISQFNGFDTCAVLTVWRHL